MMMMITMIVVIPGLQMNQIDHHYHQGSDEIIR